MAYYWKELLSSLKELYKDTSGSNYSSKELKNASFEEYEAIGKIVLNAREKSRKEVDTNLKCLSELKQKYTLYELCFSKTIDISDKID